MKVVDRKNASKIIGVSVRTVDRYIKKDELPKIEVGGRIFIKVEDLNTFLGKQATNYKSLNIADIETIELDEYHRPIPKTKLKIQSESVKQKQNDQKITDDLRPEIENQKTKSEQIDDNYFKKLYAGLQDELKDKQARLEGANYRVGQLEGMLKESIPMLDFKKAIALEKEKREDLENILDEFEKSTEELTFKLENKENEIEQVNTKLKEERINKNVFLVILIILFLLQPLWLIIPPVN
ncbi:helix-turn-helix domain-containing protein [Candidatus Peregrinibacteria bacterium]|nr:helix-turn-helix domain-containing protein [Candidatus Peregrinibacteria bacterium]